MKMKNKCKLLVLFMALVMLFNTVSVTAFAEEQTPDGNYAQVDLNEKNAAGAEPLTVATDADKNEETSVQSDSNANVEQVQPQNDESFITASNSDATSNTTISSEDSESLTSQTVVADADKNKEISAQSDSNAKVESVQWDISKSKEATNLDENFESNVTLSLPAGVYKGNLDVVFILDGSTSTDAANLAESAAGLLDELAQFKNLNVKAGVVIFGGSVPLLYNGELVALTADSLASLKSVLTDKSYDGIAGRSGSNLQAGVKAGQQLLNADSTVADSDKYLILLTDGGARMWVNENGEAMSQGFRQNNAQSVAWGQNQDFTSRYIEAGEGAMPLRTFDEVWNAGSTDASFAKYAMTQAEAGQTDAWKNAANWETVCEDKDGAYYTSLEVSTYYAATSIIDAGKHAHVIWVDYSYHSGKYAEYTDSFKSWLNQNGYITRYESNGQGGDTIFAHVKDQLIYLLDAGSYVVDYMGYVENDYNLDFINKAETLTLTVGDDEKLVVDLGNNTYGFGEKLENGSYEYQLTYYPADSGEEYFKWDINVPVTKDKPVKLTYKVELVNPKSIPGIYGVYDKFGEQNDGSAEHSLYTNNKATLYPVDSNKQEGDPEDFKKPTVSYEVSSTPTPEEKTGNLTVSKVVAGNAGDTTKDFTFTVKLGDETINGSYGDMTFENGVATFTLKHNEKKTATGLPAGISYKVTESEANQDGYTTTAIGATGSIVKDETTKAEFTNKKDRTQVTPNNPNVPDKPATPTDSAPHTGDESNVVFYLVLMIISFSVFTGLCIFRRRRSSTGYHIQK